MPSDWKIERSWSRVEPFNPQPQKSSYLIVIGNPNHRDEGERGWGNRIHGGIIDLAKEMDSATPSPAIAEKGLGERVQNQI